MGGVHPPRGLDIGHLGAPGTESREPSSRQPGGGADARFRRRAAPRPASPPWKAQVAKVGVRVPRWPVFLVVKYSAESSFLPLGKTSDLSRVPSVFVLRSDTGPRERWAFITKRKVGGASSKAYGAHSSIASFKFSCYRVLGSIGRA